MAKDRPASSAIETLQGAARLYAPPKEFAAKANAKPDIYNQPLEEFWDREAKTRISWFKPLLIATRRLDALIPFWF